MWEIKTEKKIWEMKDLLCKEFIERSDIIVLGKLTRVIDLPFQYLHFSPGVMGMVLMHKSSMSLKLE